MSASVHQSLKVPSHLLPWQMHFLNLIILIWISCLQECQCAWLAMWFWHSLDVSAFFGKRNRSILSHLRNETCKNGKMQNFLNSSLACILASQLICLPLPFPPSPSSQISPMGDIESIEMTTQVTSWKIKREGTEWKYDLNKQLPHSPGSPPHTNQLSSSRPLKKGPEGGALGNTQRS